MTAEHNQPITLVIPATYADVRHVEPCIRGIFAQLRGSDLQELQVLAYNTVLAVHEICTNIVGHAYKDSERGMLTLTLTLLPAPRRLVVELHDTGRPFNPNIIALPDLEEGQEHGYGLFLARSLMDEVHYEATSSGNHWQLVKLL